MLVERPVKEALRDYLKGKKVVVILEFDDGSIDLTKMEDILPQDGFHYLVDVPAVPNPDFEQTVQDMIKNSVAESVPEATADPEPVESKTEESDSMEPAEGEILTPPRDAGTGERKGSSGRKIKA